MATLLVYAGPSQTHQILAEDGTDLTARQQLKRGAVVGVYDRLSGQRPGRRILANKNWAIIHVAGLSYGQARRMIEGPDDVDVDEYGPRLRHFWRLAWLDLPLAEKKKINRNEEITASMTAIKGLVRHRETNLTMDRV